MLIKRDGDISHFAKKAFDFWGSWIAKRNETHRKEVQREGKKEGCASIVTFKVCAWDTLPSIITFKVCAWDTPDRVVVDQVENMLASDDAHQSKVFLQRGKEDGCGLKLWGYGFTDQSMDFGSAGIPLAFLFLLYSPGD